jgi:adenine specific DNA methylase Mod
MQQKDDAHGLGAALRNNEKAKPNTALLEVLKTALPQYFEKDVYDEEGILIKEGSFKTDKFLAELKANNISEAHDGYKLGFVGKDYARLQVGRASETMIAPDCKHNSKEENAKSENIFITGDNLEALRHLVNAYERQIKLIYIDPPYNTGKEFTYSDTFEYNDEKLNSALGYSEEEITRLKSIQGKSSHSAWLTFMYPRLKLAQKLLKDDGVIFISIDDNEQANLRLLMDDIFGESNFCGLIVWQTATDNNPTQIATEHEYVLCYAKNRSEQDYWEISSDKGKLIQEKYEELKSIHKNNVAIIQKELRKWIRSKTNGEDLSGVSHYSYIDDKGVYYPGNSSNTKPGGYIYDIIHPRTKKVCKKPDFGYRWPFDTFSHANKEGDVLWGDDETIIPKIKKRLDTVTQKLKSYYYEDNRSTSAELKELFSGIKVFDNPKSINFLNHIISFVTNQNDIIMDFFAGSATTAHAIMQLNAEDLAVDKKANRKFILVQLDEKTYEETANGKKISREGSDEAFKAGYNTIDEIARKRIELAAKKVKEEAGLLAGELDLGFKHYRLITPDTKTLDKITEFNPQNKKLFNDDMISPFAYKKTGTGGLDVLLTTWLIDAGLPFNTKVDELSFADYKANYVAELATLYLISPDWNTKALKALLNSIGKNQLNVTTIVVYPYSFTFEALRELRTNIHTNLENSIAILERY